MLAATSASSSSWSTSSAFDAHDNIWRGPTASSSTLAVKPAASSVRKIRRKPVPIIPAELLPHPPSASSITPGATSPRPALAAKSLNSPALSDTTPTQELQPSVLSSQKPQRQYLLDIDAPSTSQDTSETQNDSVKQLLRSATISPSTASYRTRRIKWMQDKDEHAEPGTSASLSPRQPTLSRKTSISAHLKMSLRRNKAEEPTTPEISISGPTNFVHIATGGDGGQSAPNGAALKRSSTVNARSSSTYSAESRVSVEDGEEKPLYAAVTRSPLRPLKSIRRPSKLSLDKAAEVVLAMPAVPTSPKDKRKAIYAAPGLVPAILEPVSPASLGREQFAASLGRRSEQMSPEPELSRSPSSGYESSEGTSNRSSLASLHEFRTFLDFPDLPVGKRREEREVKVWSDALSVPMGVPVQRV